MRRLLIAWGLLLSLLPAVAGCGDRDRAEGPPDPVPAQAEPEPEPAPPPPPPKPVGLLPAPEWVPAAASESGRPSVLLLGLDGAEWQVLDALFEAGFLPNLSRLAGEGARAELDCAPAMPETACLCPPVWVSMVTGVPYEKHGVSTRHHQTGDRGAPTLWDVLYADGGSSTLAAFSNTWPPEASARYVLTEYGLDWAAGQIFERVPLEKPLLREMMAHQRFRPEDLLEQLEMLPHEGGRLPVWKSLARDRVAMQALLHLAPRDRTDLTAVLLHSPDKSQHLAWGAVQKTPEDAVDADAVVAQARAWEGPVRSRLRAPGSDVASQYLESDAWLGRLLSRVGYDYIVVVSDHGMARNPGEGLPGDHGVESPEAHQGVLVVWGPGVRAGARLEGADVFDVAPTVAHLLGLSVAEDLPGEVLQAVFTPEWRDAHPVARVPQWDPEVPSAEAAAPSAAAFPPPPQENTAGSTSTPTGQ